MHDIYFIWERAEFLQLDSDEILCQASFKVLYFKEFLTLNKLNFLQQNSKWSYAKS